MMHHFRLIAPARADLHCGLRKLPLRGCCGAENDDLNRQLWAVFAHRQEGGAFGYINATSTCDCGLRVGLAGESVRMLMQARVRIAPEQRLVA